MLAVSLGVNSTWCEGPTSMPENGKWSTANSKQNNGFYKHRQENQAQGLMVNVPDSAKDLAPAIG